MSDRLTASLEEIRQHVEDRIEFLIALLDALDGDVDLEPGDNGIADSDGLQWFQLEGGKNYDESWRRTT